MTTSTLCRYAWFMTRRIPVREHLFRMFAVLTIIVVSNSAAGVLERGSAADDTLAASVEQLRQIVGRWAVVTEFLHEDGSVARTVTGTYDFSWVVPDRVVSGISSIPEIQQTAGILFYINEKERRIEMVSVGRDGFLWIMTGAVGEEIRYSQPYKSPSGSEQQLRFTRFNITPDFFESSMEYTTDGGNSWLPGNHQIFTRVK